MTPESGNIDEEKIQAEFSDLFRKWKETWPKIGTIPARPQRITKRFLLTMPPETLAAEMPTQKAYEELIQYTVTLLQICTHLKVDTREVLEKLKMGADGIEFWSEFLEEVLVKLTKDLQAHSGESQGGSPIDSLVGSFNRELGGIHTFGLTEQASAMQGGKRWQDVLAAHPEAQPGEFNELRKGLLEVGIYFDVDRRTAEGWIDALREQRQTAEADARTQNLPIPEIKEPVRLTIVDISEETKRHSSGGAILVEADGIRAEIDASSLYNCIKGKKQAPDVVSVSSTYLPDGVSTNSVG